MNKDGQAIMETALLILVIAAALLAMQVYLKRGIQGKLRGGTETIGAQYDPTNTNSSFISISNSLVETTSESMEPVVVRRTLCPGGAHSCVDWDETYAPKRMTVRTIYDISNSSGREVVGSL